jgi:predicted unusual protein kinase regulating ubiquinone biosynthesis (AarF/ABC1/UbiB family)
MFFEHLGTYITLFFRLAYTHQVKLDHNFVCVAMAIKVMEGLAIALDPELGASHTTLIPTTQRSTIRTQLSSISLDIRA